MSSAEAPCDRRTTKKSSPPGAKELLLLVGKMLRLIMLEAELLLRTVVLTEVLVVGEALMGREAVDVELALGITVAEVKKTLPKLQAEAD